MPALALAIDAGIQVWHMSILLRKAAAQKRNSGRRAPQNALRQQVGTLSGGNQQKVVLAKWLLKNPDIIIFDEPTRGIDVGSKQEFYNPINELAKQGKSILFISSEMPEIIGMCDRVIILCEGRLTGVLEKEDITQVNLMALASGEAIS